MKQYIILLTIGIFFLYSCEKKDVNPKIVTSQAIPISASSCIAKAHIEEMGSYAITDHGFVFSYGTTDNLSYISTQDKISLGKTITADTFSATVPLTGSSYYSSEYKYFVRAYISNEKGTVYGNAVSFDPLVMSLQSISPSAAKTGDTITIIGNNFDLIASNNKVQFYSNGTIIASVIEASKTKLKVIVPLLSSYYYDSYWDITVTTGGQSTTLYDVFSIIPSVSSFSPSSGTFGTSITISGSNLGQISGIMFGQTTVNSYSTGSNYVTVYVPNNIALKKFKIYVLKGGAKMEVPGGEFTMNKLVATSFSPTKANPGSSVTISGNNFNSSYSYNTIFFGTTGVTASYSSNGTTSITANVPTNLTAGDYNLSVSNGLDTIALPGKLTIVVPSITSISPTSGYVGTDLTIKGHYFNIGYSYVYFNGSSYYTYSNDSSTYKITVPNYAPGTYKISVYNGVNQIYAPTDFTILAPTLTSIAPTTGTVGTAVIIKGDGFGTSASNVSVKFGSLNATISAINNTQINAIVPSGVGGGAWMVTVTVNGYTIANSLAFSVP